MPLGINGEESGAAPGYRDAGYYGRLGDLTDIGNYGYSWSSTISGANSQKLRFYVTGLTPSHAGNRAYGFQLRCLSE
ncbi:hypothetical protein [uncultured Rikenella sp.]|uniref:hypothetical protein n=1 Tax=uncultured Rikenella sp. TaxID=368003 RepID=UPI0026123CCB|nr:hypothetical protein [uncultured Rikenella sp.]